MFHKLLLPLSGVVGEHIVIALDLAVVELPLLVAAAAEVMLKFRLGGDDELLPAVVDIILESNQVSVSLLQRKLKLGYVRAARIVGELEYLGVVSPFNGDMPRKILITQDTWDYIQSEIRKQHY